MPMIERLADNALTTVEAALEIMGLPGGEGNALWEKDVLQNNIIRLINAASAWFETMTGRRFGRQIYTETHKGSGTQELVLGQYPILDVEYVRDILTKEDISPDTYDWEESGHVGVLYREAGWPLRGYPSGLAEDFAALSRYLRVRYTAGYILPKDGTEETPATLPADIQSVVWGIVQQELSILRNGAQGLAAFSVSDMSWTFDKEPRASWMETVHKYQRY